MLLAYSVDNAALAKVLKEMVGDFKDVISSTPGLVTQFIIVMVIL